MDNLLRELESLKITGDFSKQGLFSTCIDMVQKSLVPAKAIGDSRPCEEKDFREYREDIDRYLRNIRSMLQHILWLSCSELNVQIYCNLPIVRCFVNNLLLLIGEHHEKNVWNTAESVSVSKDLANGILVLYGCQSISEVLHKLDNFVNVVLMLRPKLLKETWKCNPAAVACYKWVIFEVEEPTLYNHIHDVLPSALIIVDDFVPDNTLIGLQCLQRIIEHSHMKKGLIDSGYTEVMFHALERLLQQRQAKYVVPVYACISSLLATMEHWDSISDILEWTTRDDVLSVLFDCMELEQNIELRRSYMLSLPQLLTNYGCAKWSERLARILAEYCEHHTDLRTLKATLETAKAFLLMFHLGIAAYCVPLYTAFLKLHFDLTETPVLDTEIMRNLEDCICLLYKLSPDVGCAIMNDDRMRLVVKNSLQVVRFGDTKYFE